MTTPKRIGPITQAWIRWKALRLPWRRRFLVGLDLDGNTYWEFRVAGSGTTERLRRIVKYPRSTHYSEVRISPQWHQWLRYTREEPPSIAEQRSDVGRRARMRTLAAEADARWEAKPRVMEDPSPPRQAIGGGAAPPGSSASASAPAAQKQKQREDKDKDKDPWAAAKATGPGETWQPETWTPPAPKRR